MTPRTTPELPSPRNFGLSCCRLNAGLALTRGIRRSNFTDDQRCSMFLQNPYPQTMRCWQLLKILSIPVRSLSKALGLFCRGSLPTVGTFRFARESGLLERLLASWTLFVNFGSQRFRLRKKLNPSSSRYRNTAHPEHPRQGISKQLR